MLTEICLEIKRNVSALQHQIGFTVLKKVTIVIYCYSHRVFYWISKLYSFPDQKQVLVSSILCSYSEVKMSF